MNVIKYFVEECRLDAAHCSYDGTSCLMFACSKQSLDVIKCLINSCKLDLNHMNVHGETCLTFASAHNQHIDVIRYLVESEECKMDPNHLNREGFSCHTRMFIQS